MNVWNIQSRASACQSCAKEFTDKQPFHTILSEEKMQFVRMDVCPACWQSQFSQGANERKGFLSHWQGEYHVPPAAAPEPIRKENAENLLRKLIELNNPRFIGPSYILAVMLERKRLLKVKEQYVREGQRIFVYEQPKTGDIFTIPDPDLHLQQLEAVQRDVALLLEFGLSPEGEILGPDSVAATPNPTDASAAPDGAEKSGEPTAAELETDAVPAEPEPAT